MSGRWSDLLKTVTPGSAGALEEGGAMWSRVFDPAWTGPETRPHPSKPNLPTISLGFSNGSRLCHRIILGKDMAEQIGAGSGRWCSSPVHRVNSRRSGMVQNIFVQVIGIFNSGFFDYDSSWGVHTGSRMRKALSDSAT